MERNTRGNLTGIRGGKGEFFRRVEQLWNRRGDIQMAATIVRRIMKLRICPGCLDILPQTDPRITCCTRACAQQHRRFTERLRKEERNAA